MVAEGEMKKVMLLVIATMYFAICESCNSLIKVCRELIAFYLKNFKNMNPIIKWVVKYTFQFFKITFLLGKNDS